MRFPNLLAFVEMLLKSIKMDSIDDTFVRWVFINEPLIF